MQIINEATERVDVRSLKPHPRNPNTGQLGPITDSIEANGFFGHIIVQRSTGHILVGHHRFEAAKTLGATEVPVQWVDVDDQKALRIMLADNRTAELGVRDPELVAELLAELNLDGGLTGTGYGEEDLNALIAQLAPEEPKTESVAYEQKFQLVVDVGSEAQQEELFGRLTEEGWTCRILTL